MTQPPHDPQRLAALNISTRLFDRPLNHISYIDAGGWVFAADVKDALMHFRWRKAHDRLTMSELPHSHARWQELSAITSQSKYEIRH